MSEVGFRTSATVPVEHEAHPADWVVALSGGEGIRLKDYVARRFGYVVPKQYCPLLGSRSTLQHTLARLNRVTPLPARTLAVIGETHAAVARPQPAGAAWITCSASRPRAAPASASTSRSR